MKKQIDGQLNLFDYIPDKTDNYLVEDQKNKRIENQIIEQKSANKKAAGKDNKLIKFFKECEDCWCSDCKHNEKLDGIVRDFAGKQSPCPACLFCIKSKKAEICEIHSYENGCKLRAVEEGIEP